MVMEMNLNSGCIRLFNSTLLITKGHMRRAVVFSTHSIDFVQAAESSCG
jgi:hypothetical protein